MFRFKIWWLLLFRTCLLHFPSVSLHLITVINSVIYVPDGVVFSVALFTYYYLTYKIVRVHETSACNGVDVRAVWRHSENVIRGTQLLKLSQSNPRLFVLAVRCRKPLEAFRFRISPPENFERDDVILCAVTHYDMRVASASYRKTAKTVASEFHICSYALSLLTVSRQSCRVSMEHVDGSVNGRI